MGQGDSTRAAMEKRWREEMRLLGRDAVRQRFINREAIIDLMPYPEADFVRKWLDQEERNAKFWPRIVTALTLIFAAIAAWPIIKSWLP
jgi:hypothetical protein